MINQADFAVAVARIQLKNSTPMIKLWFCRCL